MAKIYLSSTYEDLKEYRAAVALALRRLRHQIIGMEDYVAAEERPLDKCLKDVAECDVYVGIFAWRYGYVPQKDNPERKSITELEYREATSLGKTRLIFMVSEGAPWPRKLMDGGGEAQRIEALRDELGKEHLVNFFSEENELARLVNEAVTSVHPGFQGRERPRKVAAADRDVKIVPRGLRSFEAEDHQWFLRLVPGPRDESGLPTSIDFWKRKLEEDDPDQTFRVGLIYGPSGCGKSSLVKAGLIPALAEFVIPVYVEATAKRTEAKLVGRLRKVVAGLPEDDSLSRTLAYVRAHPEVLSGHKVVLLVDQFEQWLHAHRATTEGELTEALRQCDGGTVQAVVMVRDEFIAAVNRFFYQVHQDVRIQEGINMAFVDLFDTDHARFVLAEYGRAYGRLPEVSEPLGADQQLFLDKVVEELKTSEGKVVSVQIALLAQMLKGRPWTSDTLVDVGGTEGVGMKFLEENFDQPKTLYHSYRAGAMAVLNALLPDSGTDIRGHSRSARELQDAARLGERPDDFNRLIRILDEDLRIVTPTVPTQGEGEAGVVEPVGVEARYQLTHDYLVPSLRN